MLEPIDGSGQRERGNFTYDERGAMPAVDFAVDNRGDGLA